MKVFIADNYEDLSGRAADEFGRLMQSRKNPVACVASGDTPAGMYKRLVDKAGGSELNISDWYFLGLDEWVGMNGDDEGSCRFHLNNQLFNPLLVDESKICFFDGRSKDLTRECEDVEDFILQHGGIDVSVLGLGMNGHIGMNEPGTSPASRSHVAGLDPVTQKTGQKYFKNPQQLNEGITLGLSTLMDSRHIILLISGGHKSGIVKKILEGEVSEQLPGSLLRKHPGLKIFLDVEASKELQKTNYD